MPFITLTGADDTIQHERLWHIAEASSLGCKNHGNIEWGILYSTSNQGSGRYPSFGWIEKLASTILVALGPSFALHVCGRAVHDFIDGRGQPPRVFGGDAVLLFIPSLFALQDVEREIFCHLCQPRRGIVRHAVVGPGLQRAQQRLLHHVLGKLQPAGAEVRGERGDHLCAFVAEKMISDLTSAGTVPAHASVSHR